MKNNETNKPNSNSNENDAQLFQQIPIEDTPFVAVKYDDKWFLALGKYRLTQPLKTLEEVKQQSTDASWARIMQVIQIMILEHELESTKRLQKELNLHN